MTDQERTDWAIAEAFTDVRREWETTAWIGNRGVSEAHGKSAASFCAAVDARAAEYAKDAPRADGLDVERLAKALNVAVPRLLWQPGARVGVGETDRTWARTIAAEYAKLGEPK